jgi:hypothetical protein
MFHDLMLLSENFWISLFAWLGSLAFLMMLGAKYNNLAICVNFESIFKTSKKLRLTKTKELVKNLF